MQKLELMLDSINWDSSVILDNFTGILNLNIVWSGVLWTNSTFPLIFSVSILEQASPSPILWSLTFVIDYVWYNSPNGLNKNCCLSCSMPIPESIISVVIYFDYFGSCYSSSLSNYNNSSFSYILIEIIMYPLLLLYLTAF